MLESKIEELKNTSPAHSSLSPSIRGTKGEPYKINTKIDLNISIFIDNNFFSSELDKINFYREIESLNTIEDLESIISDFKESALTPTLSQGEKEKDRLPR